MNGVTVTERIGQYLKMKVWVYPSNLEERPWAFWKGKKDKEYLELLQHWNLDDATGLKLVIGKKGIRGIEIRHIENTESVIQEVLELLGIPDKEYPWIIDRRDGVAVIVDTPNTSSTVMGMTNREYGNVRMLWEGYYTLPSIGVLRYFYGNRLPKEHPAQVSDNTFVECFEAMIAKYR